MLRDFAWRLNAAAEKVDLRQVEIAARLGAKPQTVGNWFQGLNYPRKRERHELAKLLGVTLGWLMEGNTDPGPTTVEEQQAGYTAVREVPVISWTHAGVAATYEEMPRHFQGKVATNSTDRRAFALTIEGDSMWPTFLPGDKVICEPSNEPRNSKPVVAKFADDAVQLRIYHKLKDGRIQLASLRPEIYPTQDYDPKEFHWIYPVRELVRSV